MNLRDRLTSVATVGDRHEVDMLIRKGSVKPSDDSPFANEIFDPACKFFFFHATDSQLTPLQLPMNGSTHHQSVYETQGCQNIRLPIMVSSTLAQLKRCVSFVNPL